MPNIKLEIEYDGTNYAGWQIQNSHKSQGTGHKLRTIQETIEWTLQKILQEKVKVIASGRTDSGVHALAQAANFRTKSKLSLLKIQKALNSLLPGDISIKKIKEVKESFHSRYQVKTKTYRYIIHNDRFPSVFLTRFSWHIPYKLDIKLMRQEAKTLIGTHSFKSFCASGSTVKTTTRTIQNIAIKTIGYTLYAIRYALIIIDIEADGFLYNMVRNIAGTLVEIGRGRLAKGSLKRILQAKDRRLAGPTAPPQGLFLRRVKYY